MTRTVSCIEAEALGEVLALPESDPRRAHVEGCPRCRALALSYRQFLAPAAETTASYGTAEDAQLTAFRERLIGLAPAVTTPAAEARAAAKPRGGGPFAPAWRPIWALAAIAIAFGVYRFTPRSARVAPEAPALRGGSAVSLAPREPVYGSGGGVTLAWPAVAGADRYQLRFFSTALAEIGRRDAGAGLEVTLGPADLPESYRNGDAVLFRVVALHGDDEVLTSALASLHRP